MINEELNDCHAEWESKNEQWQTASLNNEQWQRICDVRIGL